MTSSPDQEVPHLWYAVRTKPNHEGTVEMALANRGIECFLPRYPRPRKRKQRVVKVQMPLFPGYVFVFTDIGQQRIPILEYSGVLFIVSHEFKPVPIPDHEMESIQKLVISGLELTPEKEFTKGTFIEVVAGPLAGVTGRVRKAKGKKRIICAVELLGRAVSAELPVDVIWKTSQS
jgi:transcription antitermination factor NusG